MSHKKDNKNYPVIVSEIEAAMRESWRVNQLHKSTEAKDDQEKFYIMRTRLVSAFIG